MKKIFKLSSFQRRFFLIFFIFLIFSIYQIFADSFSQLYKLKRDYDLKKESAVFIHDLSLLVFEIQKTRGITNIYLNNKTFNIEVINKQHFNVLKELNKIINKYEHLNANKQLKLISKELSFIKKNLYVYSSQRIFYKYTLLVDRLMSFVNITSYNNNLHKNSSVSSKILMELLINEIPFTIETFGNARGITAGNLIDEHNIENKNNEITFYSKLIFLDMKKINMKLKSLINYDTDFSDEIKSTNKILKRASYDFISLLNTQTNNKNLSIEKAQEFYETSSVIINKYISVYNKLFLILNKEFQNEYRNLVYKYYTKIFIETLFVFFALIIFVLFYKSSLTYINRIKKAEKIKSDFLSNMSHEIRTPLNAIIGFIKLIKENKDDKKDEYLNVIDKSSQQLLFIINDILDLSKIEKNKVKLDLNDFNIKKEFDLIINLFSANAMNKNINLILDIKEDVPLFIKSDIFRLKQIISNLISNAIKFTPTNGEIKLTLCMNKDKLKFSLKDNGIGIPKNKQKTIFNSFSQVDEATTRKYGGTGLGLTISSNLVKIFSSKLLLVSKENEGSTFSFEITFEKSMKKIEDLEIKEVIKKYSGKILLVEDNPTNQFLMNVTFDNLNLEVCIANDGIEAIKCFKEDNSYDLIFMDENMPNMNGIEASKQIIEYEKSINLKHTPIVALTANAQKDDKKRFLNAGLDEYLSKPLEMQLLYKILDKYL